MIDNENETALAAYKVWWKHLFKIECDLDDDVIRLHDRFQAFCAGWEAAGRSLGTEAE